MVLDHDNIDVFNLEPGDVELWQKVWRYDTAWHASLVLSVVWKTARLAIITWLQLTEDGVIVIDRVESEMSLKQWQDTPSCIIVKRKKD